MGDFISGLFLGLVVDNVADAVFNGVKSLCVRTLRFNNIVRGFSYRVEYIESQIERGLVDDQNMELKRRMQKARVLLNKCLRVGSGNLIKKCRYGGNIIQLLKGLAIHVEILESRIQDEILELSRNLTVMTERLGRTNMPTVDSANVFLVYLDDLLRRQTQIANLKANLLEDVSSIIPDHASDSDTVIKESSIHVGLDVPLRELKRKLFTDGVSRLVVTGNGGCGKTELAKQFCQDDEVQDAFKTNIFFVTVSKQPRLDCIIQQLYQQMGSEACTFQHNVSEGKWLEQFIKEAGQNPLLLVLDDVWSGSESLLQKLVEFIQLNKIQNYKLLVTSRIEFPSFGSSYYLNLLNNEDAMDLVSLKWLATPTLTNSVFPRMEKRKAMAVDDLREDQFKAVKRDFTNISQGLLRTLIQSKSEKGSERTKEIKWHGLDVDTIFEDSKFTQELQFLSTDQVQVQEKMRQFRAWIGDPDDGGRDLEISVASKKWFKHLMTPGEWLTDTHVDAFLYFVRKNPHYHLQSLPQSCTVLDTVFWSWMTGRWTSFQNNPNSYKWDSDILSYPLGQSPRFTRPWSEVDYLYIPVNITNQHWIAVRVDLMRRKFTIYDSMQSATCDEFICDKLNHLAMMFPSLLIQSGFYEMRPELSPLNIPFQVVRQAESIPQQSESGDCGVFMLKFVEYLSSGQQLSFEDKDIPEFRYRMAFSLFAMSHDIGGNTITHES